MNSYFLNKRQILFGSSVALLTILGSSVNIQHGYAQGMMADNLVDKFAAKTIEKFNGMSCQQLKSGSAMQSSMPEDPRKAQIKAKFIAALKSDPQLKARFFSQISDPILTKLFDCGVIPKH
jgi:hypothetical protein